MKIMLIEKEKFAKKNLNIKTRLFSMILLIAILLFFSIFVFFKAWNSHTIKQLFYTETSHLDYKVCLKENEYFSEKCLDKDLQYIANLIENIQTEFEYNFNASDYFAYDYTYYITAKITASEKGDPNKILYNKEETVLDEKTSSSGNANAFLIKESLLIDYTKYNNLMTAFRKDYTLTLDSKLVFTMYINIKGKYEGVAEEIEETRNISITIPLSEQTLDINMDYTEINESNLIESKASFNFINILLYILSLASMISTLPLMYKAFKSLREITKSRMNFDRQLKKILREYDQLIVETKRVPDLNGSKVLDVSTFEELLDVREVIHKPILYIKIREHKAIFIITNENEAYRYILKEEGGLDDYQKYTYI